MMLFAVSCADDNALEQNVVSARDKDRPLLNEFMSQTDLNSWDRQNCSTEQLFAKFAELKTEFGDDRSAKTTRFFIIADIVKRGDYPDDKIVFLLDELERYDMAYPVESYLLLEQAEKHNAMPEDQIRKYGERAYKKALTKAYLHEEMLKTRTAPDLSDMSYEAGVYRMYHARAEYTEKLTKYAPSLQ